MSKAAAAAAETTATTKARAAQNSRPKPKGVARPKRAAGIFATRAPELARAGWPVMPLDAGKKTPARKGWREGDVTPKRVRSWINDGCARCNVGLRLGGEHGLVAIDVDVDDENVSEALGDYIELELGALPRRVGRAPRALYLCRVEGEQRKQASTTYFDLLTDTARVEILGEGQQCAIVGVHPDTGSNYAWADDGEALAAGPSALPLVTREQLVGVVAEFEALAAAEGWEEARRGSSGAAPLPDGVSEEDRALWAAEPRLGVELSELCEWLAAVDAAGLSYEDWLGVGMGLWHETNGSSDGLELWEDWSSEDAGRYRAGDCAARWPTFKPAPGQRPKTAATLRRMAREAAAADDGGDSGGDSTAADSEPLDLTGMSEAADPVAYFLSRFVYVAEGDRVADLKAANIPVWPMVKFRNLSAAVAIYEPAPTAADPDKTKRLAVSQLWLTNESRKTAVDTGYKPDAGRLFVEQRLRYVNTFHWPVFPDNPRGSTALFYEHMEFLFPVECEREWFIDWLAFTLQRPAERCKVVPLHIATPQGTGRGWLGQLLEELLGVWNVEKTTINEMMSDKGFNDYLHESLCVIVEETHSDGRNKYAVNDRIRDQLIEPRIALNLKFGKKFTARVYANFFMQSNRYDALVLPYEDRRIHVLTGPEDFKPYDYYKRLYQWLRTDGVAVLAAELRARDLSSFNWTRAPMTEGKRRMLQNTGGDTEQVIAEIFDDMGLRGGTMEQLRAAAESLGCAADVSDQQFAKLLQKRCSGPHRVKIDGKAHRVYALSDESQTTQNLRRIIGKNLNKLGGDGLC